MSQFNFGTQTSSGLPRVKGPEFNDRDRLNDLLMTEKHLCAAYSISATEASNDHLASLCLEILEETHHFQRTLFNLMHQKGWYKLEAEDGQKIQKTLEQFENYRTQFPYN